MQVVTSGRLIEMRNLFLLLFLVCSIGAAPKPDIILILADDLGRDWVGCYGANNQPPTSIG